MSRLRSDACQAIAESWFGVAITKEQRRIAERALDALLDYLEAHTEEWVAGAHEFVLTTDSIFEGLIAALRVEP